MIVTRTALGGAHTSARAADVANLLLLNIILAAIKYRTVAFRYRLSR